MSRESQAGFYVGAGDLNTARQALTASSLTHCTIAPMPLPYFLRQGMSLNVEPCFGQTLAVEQAQDAPASVAHCL